MSTREPSSRATDLGPVRLDPRYTGFPGQLHGGYLAGLAAAPLGGSAQVTLRRPVAAGEPLRARRTGAGHVELWAGEALAAAAVPWSQVRRGRPDAVEVPRIAVAAAAAAAWPAPVSYAVPDCFVCGPRPPHGLHLAVAPLAGRPVVAGRWRPAGDGAVAAEQVWAVLDCPCFWALALDGPRAGHAVTGQLTVQLCRPVQVGHDHVVLAWPVATQGRALVVRSAVLTGEGEVAAHGTQRLLLTSWGFDLSLLPRVRRTP